MAIITSLLDVDFYKFTMGNLVFLKHKDVPVTYSFTCRTPNVPLASIIGLDNLQRELEAIQELKFNQSEIDYLQGIKNGDQPMFGSDYLQFLKDLQMPPFKLENDNGKIKLEFSGKWSEAIYWETIALGIINELYYQTLLEKMSPDEKDNVYQQGNIRLMEKIKILQSRPDVAFIEFGTRRRFSKEWQDHVVKTLKNELPNSQLVGTSNVYLANKYGLTAMGTFAHELPMAYSGIYHGSDNEIRSSHNKVLQDWWELYGYSLSIALTDTYGSDFFFRDFTEEQARNWKGFRQDSGSPIEFGEQSSNFYGKFGIDTRNKLFVPSDGLTLPMILEIADNFNKRFKITDGWGTDLTNDLGLKPLSLVIKLTESNGHGTVKLSDNLAKAIGKPEDIELFKKIFGHTVTRDEATTY